MTLFFRSLPAIALPSKPSLPHFYNNFHNPIIPNSRSISSHSLCVSATCPISLVVPNCLVHIIAMKLILIAMKLIKNGLEQDDLYRELANEAAAHKKRKAQVFEGHPEGGQSSKVPSLPQNETDKKRKALRSKADEGHPEAGQSSKVPSLPQSETDKNGKASVHEGHPEAGQSSKVPSHEEKERLRSPPTTALLQRAVNAATRRGGGGPRGRGRGRGFKAR